MTPHPLALKLIHSRLSDLNFILFTDKTLLYVCFSPYERQCACYKACHSVFVKLSYKGHFYFLLTYLFIFFKGGSQSMSGDLTEVNTKTLRQKCF